MRAAWRGVRRPERLLAAKPDNLVGIIRMPHAGVSPLRSIARRLVVALAALLTSVVLVYLERDGYVDFTGGELSLLDCFYYASVSLSTTGYGDIVPVSTSARLVNVVIITPLRVLFLIILVGTTLEVLTERSRQTLRIQRWRSRVKDHVVIIGYGTKGRSAIAALMNDGVDVSELVVVDTDPRVLESAEAHGLVAVQGSGTRSDVLRMAEVHRARSVVIAPDRDDAAVLMTLTTRELAPHAQVVVAVRESENVHLLQQSGADSVVVSSETAGRLLGMATLSPSLVDLFETIISSEAEVVLAERALTPDEYGRSPRDLAETVLAVVREAGLVPVDSPAAAVLRPTDRVIYLRNGGSDRARPDGTGPG
ncbi:NAD-binding protein [Actinoalloteichus spitiensis]|uniref:potassium channel family protein n=1 Tax=Actinoalloteichus spitiensis TaxID=252394 RepID=UPI00037AC505